MQRMAVALSTAVALITEPLVFGSNHAEATVTALPLGRAAQSINPIEKTACWRLGWRGWGLYPCYYYYAYPYYGYYGYGYAYDAYGQAPWGGFGHHWGGWGHRWGSRGGHDDHR